MRQPRAPQLPPAPRADTTITADTAPVLDVTTTIPPGRDPADSLGRRRWARPAWRSIVAWSAGFLAVAIILALVLPGQHEKTVNRVDPTTAIARAHGVADFPLFTPNPLPAGWATDSARYDVFRNAPHLHIGYRAPDGGFVGLEESTIAPARVFVAQMSAGGVVKDMVSVGGVNLFVLSSAHDRKHALVWYGSNGAVVITGTSSVAVLEELAGSLQLPS